MWEAGAWNERFIKDTGGAITGNLSATGTITATAFVGNASSATRLQAARTLTIGNTGKSFDGSANVTWNLSEIGITNYLPLSVDGVDIRDYLNNLHAAVLMSSDMGGLALRELVRFRRVRIQEGETIIYNRGVINGCVVTRKAADVRILSLALGNIFIHGRSYGVAANIDAATVPQNSSGSAATCSIYLFINAGVVQCVCTPLNTAMPANGLLLYTISVPAGSVGDSDAFTITDARRVSPNWPVVALSAAVANISLPFVLPDADYGVYLDVISCEGGRQQIGALEVEDRLTNGFKIYLAGAADAVRVRYHVQRMI